MTRPGLPKLIATDLDGTLVRSDETVSAYTHDVLGRVRTAGIPLVGATGRGPRLTGLTMGDIRDADYLVLAGGGRVVDVTDPLAGPITLRDDRLDGHVLAHVISVLEAEVGPLVVFVEALDDPGAPLWGDPDPAWRWQADLVVRDRTESLGGKVIKGFARAVDYEVDDLLEAARRLIPATQANVTQAGLGFIEILPPAVDKASGLAVVAASLGVDPADVLVFGDMPNDLPMFAWAGWGRIAVANAHPQVRALADDVTLSNDEDGVAVWLDRLLSR